MSISQIGRSITESVTLKLNATAAALRAKGEPVIHLGGGEPKSKTPQSALDAAAALLSTGEVRYTPADGIPPLKQAIIRYTGNFYQHTVKPENVMASGGAKQAIMVALQAILDPGDEAVYPSPFWVSYPEMCKLCGAVGVAAPAEDGSFYPKVRDIERKMSRRTKLVIINSPNNPTGAMYDQGFIAEIVRFCEDRGLYLMMDDIYHRLLFDGKQPISCYRYAKDLGENSKLIVINGVSKQYAMTGFRVGWAVGNRDLIQAMTNIQSHQTSGPSAIGQAAAVGALNGDQSSVEALRATLESNREVMAQALKGLARAKLSKPDGAFYCFADFSAYEKRSDTLASLLLEKVRVVTVPGAEFGLEGHLRLSTCGSAKEITEGIGRMKQALEG